MSKPECGSCGRQGDFVTSEKIQCLVDGKIYKRPHFCDDFIVYVGRKTSEARLSDALDVRRIREAKAAEQRNREFAEKMAEKDREYNKKLWRASLWWQAVLIIFGAIFGVIGTLVVQALSK